MMTAAVRDLHRCYPNAFQTDVRTHFPEVWENNPYLACLDEKAPDVEVLDCRYPLIDDANFRPYHCLQGYIEFLNQALGLRVVPTEFRGDIHLSAEEKEWASQVHELSRCDLPFWIVSAGGKHDITIKWWSSERYQNVVDTFHGRIAFVQIGEMGHHHPKLENTIDLRGQTSVRELIRLVYHSQGCLCGVTALMHLAAAIETKPGNPPNRPCVVVAGGREPSNWEAYPHHQFLHTIGALPCCEQGGCWKSRVAPLGDRDARDKKSELCSNVANDLPRCMDMISAEHVIQRIQLYFDGGALPALTEMEAAAAGLAIRASQNNPYDLHSLNRYDAPKLIERTAAALPEYPERFSGRGIVVCGGGLKYFPCAWVCIQMLRQTGCSLPIELWYEGKEEMDRAMISLLEPLGVRCVDALEMERLHPRRTSGGWELKAYALLQNSFEEVLLLDADNVPVKDPAFLFDLPEFKRTGSIFWPDYGSLAPEREIWSICGIPYQNEPEFESGQILVNKRLCWRPLNLAFWFNDHSDFFFQYIHGDKETFHMAWRKLGMPYTMVPTPIKSLDGIMCQHDLNGRRLFQHRNKHKWKAFAENKRVPGFWKEELCLRFLRQLEQCWDGKIHLELTSTTRDGQFVFRSGTSDPWVYHDVCEKNEYELPEHFRAKDVIIDIGAHIGSFSYACLKRGARRVLAFEAESENIRLACFNLHAFRKHVRLHRKAVWRSDRHPATLLHSGYSSCEHDVNTGGGTVLIASEKTPEHKRKETVPTIALDKVLSKFRSIQLLKLDCEGSEWPILFTSKLLGKVEKICGEYHELEDIPSFAKVRGHEQYTKEALEHFLQQRYRKVRIRPLAKSSLGHFWAEDPIPAG